MTTNTSRPRTNPDSLPTPAAGQLRSGFADAPLTAPEEELEAGLGAGSGGQSGDAMGLPREELAAAESVEALAEEGQDYEAEIVAGIEEAPDADQGGVRTHRYVAPETPWKNGS